MLAGRRLPPIWLMGLSNSTMGFGTGIAFFVLPQLMAADHVPEQKIAAITAIAFSPNFWSFLFGPILDVRFSRRWYAAVLAGLCAISTSVAICSIHHLLILESAMLTINASSMLSSSALGGWLSTITPHEHKNTLSKWMNIALISGTGVSSGLGGMLARALPTPLAAIILGAVVFLPATIFLFVPAPGPDRRLAGESFRQFNREVLSLLRQPEIVVVLLLFLCPCSTFALPNLLGGLGGDFHASAQMISLAGAIGGFVPGLLGCFIFPAIARKMPLRFFYLANGTVGCFFTLALVLLPHVPVSFGVALFAEYFFQAVAFSIQIGIVFEAIGPDNPLAATTFSFLTAATNVPVMCVILADGHAYSSGGTTRLFTVDALIGIATCAVAAILLARFDRRSARPSLPTVEFPETMQEES